MPKPKLKRGDIVTVATDSWIASAINVAQKIRSKDNDSKKNHAFVIISPQGTTFEANTKYEMQNLFERYKGKRVNIFRYEQYDIVRFNRAWKEMQKFQGRWYPFWRIPLFAIGHLSQLIKFNKGVCSETTVRFLHTYTGIPYFQHPHGWDVDELNDFLLYHDDFQTLYSGVI